MAWAWPPPARRSSARISTQARAPVHQERKTTAAAEDGEADGDVGDDEDHLAGGAGARGGGGVEGLARGSMHLDWIRTVDVVIKDENEDKLV